MYLLKALNRRQLTCDQQSGFSLIEVLVALLVLSVSLLGFAMLQTMSVRFTKSAHYRTQAINLASSFLEQVRADRVSAAVYAGSYAATTGADQCRDVVGAISSSQFRKLWPCHLGQALGADAEANVTYAGGAMTVVVSWREGHGNDNAGTVQTVNLVSQL